MESRCRWIPLEPELGPLAYFGSLSLQRFRGRAKVVETLGVDLHGYPVKYARSGASYSAPLAALSLP